MRWCILLASPAAFGEVAAGGRGALGEGWVMVGLWT